MLFNCVEFGDDELVEMIEDRLKLNIIADYIFSDEFDDRTKVIVCRELLKEKNLSDGS